MLDMMNWVLKLWWAFVDAESEFFGWKGSVCLMLEDMRVKKNRFGCSEACLFAVCIAQRPRYESAGYDVKQ